MAESVVKFFRTTSEKVNLLEVKDGQLIFAEDSRKIYLDNKTERVEYGQIISLSSDQQRENMLFPVKGGFYFIEETNCFWRFEGKWIKLTSTPETEVYFLETLPNIGVEKKIYVKDQKLYEWFGSEYKELNALTWDKISN